jgi:membrane-associated phospholipid phosphatase
VLPELAAGPDARSAWRWLPVALLLAAAAALAVDYPIAQWFSKRPYPGILVELLELCEPFGNGLGVVILLLVLHQLDPMRRWALPRVLACSLGSGLAADCVKMLVVRTRPLYWDFEGGALASFGEWFPFGSGGPGAQSFPSAHTATAFGLAFALAWLYPQGRRAFWTLAVLVACQRLQSSSHYLSDVLVGAAVGITIARRCTGPTRLANWFNKIEARFKTLRKQELDPQEVPCTVLADAQAQNGQLSRAA